MQTVQATDLPKFKRSSDLGFVRRHRNFQAETGAEYVVAKETIAIEEWNGAPAITASLSASDAFAKPLVLVISALPEGIFRVIFEDAETPRYERHIVKDIILDSVSPVSLTGTSLTLGDTYADITHETWSTKLRIQYKPFHLDLVHKSDNKSMLSLNRDSKLKVESFETKQDLDIPNQPDDLGRWEETFKTFTDPKPRGPESIGLDIVFPEATHLHGLPERTMPLALPDTQTASNETLSEPYRLYNLDVAFFKLDEPFGLYGSVPLLISRTSTKSCGIFWLNTSETYVDIHTTTEAKSTHWYSESGRLETYLLPGPTLSTVYRQYLTLTGTPFLPPLFSLGYHQCRYGYMSSTDALSVNDGMNKHDIPYDVLWLDLDHTDGKRYFTWNPETFPDPTGLQKHLASQGRKIVTIIDPHIKDDPDYPIHVEASKQNLYVTTPSHEPFFGKCWADQSSYLDFTSAATRNFWSSRFSPEHYPHFTEHLHVWNDMNEPSVFDGPEGTLPKHMLHADNVEHRHVHNRYGHDMIRATYAGLRAAREDTQRPFVLTRSFFAGSQRFASAWTGDNAAEMEHLRSTIPMLLSLQLCGIAFCGADVGGFFGDPDGELAVRWYQMGAFQPFFRGHSNRSSKRREVWLFGEPFTSYIRNAIRARYEWLALWYTLFAQVGKWGGGPPMRPIWWEFEGEGEEGWMVGESLLVMPVMEEGVARHVVKLPKGVWYDLYGEDVGVGVEGEINRECGLDRMFVFLRGGRIVPRLEGVGRSSAESGRYCVVVGLDEGMKALGEVYVDDGESYEFERGRFMYRKFACEMVEGRLVLAWETEGEMGDLGSVKVVVMGVKGKVNKVVQDGVDRKFTCEEGVVTVEGVDGNIREGTLEIAIE